MKRYLLPLAAGLLLSLPWTPIRAAEPAAGKGGVAMTLYRGGFAYVRDSRRIDLKAGANRVRFKGVPESLILESLRIAPAPGTDARSFAVSEVALKSADLTLSELLKRHVGQEISVIRLHPTSGEEIAVKGRVLSASGPILDVGGRVEVNPPGRLVFPSLPKDLSGVSSLSARVTPRTPGPVAAELHYLAHNLGWRAHYTALLNKDGSRLTLKGWAGLSNGTNIPFKGAVVAVAAGEIRAGRGSFLPRGPGGAHLQAARSDVESAPRASVGGAEIYALEGRIDLEPGERKQVALLTARDLVAEEVLVSVGAPDVSGRFVPPSAPQPAEVRLHFDNKDLAGKGVLLPAGTVRVFRPDGAGVPRYLGAGDIADTPGGQGVKLSLGAAANVTVARERVTFRRLDQKGLDVELTQRITIRNGRSKAAAVQVEEVIPGDWEILESPDLTPSREGERAVWRVFVAPEGKLAFTYSVRVQRTARR